MHLNTIQFVHSRVTQPLSKTYLNLPMADQCLVPSLEHGSGYPSLGLQG